MISCSWKTLLADILKLLSLACKAKGQLVKLVLARLLACSQAWVHRMEVGQIRYLSAQYSLTSFECSACSFSTGHWNVESKGKVKTTPYCKATAQGVPVAAT